MPLSVLIVLHKNAHVLSTLCLAIYNYQLQLQDLNAQS